MHNRSRGPDFQHRHRARADLEALDEVERRAKIEAERGANDIAVADDRHASVGKAACGSFEKSHGPRLYLQDELASWNSRNRSMRMEGRPAGVLLQLRERLSRPITEIELEKIIRQLDATDGAACESIGRLARPLERTGEYRVERDSMESPGDTTRLRAPFIGEMFVGRSPREILPQRAHRAMAYQEECGHECCLTIRCMENLACNLQRFAPPIRSEARR
jgi:hypothetical protein